MDPWTTPDAVNAVIALGALALAVRAHFVDRALQRRMDTRDEGRRRDEVHAQQSAHVVAVLEPRASARDFVLQNRGASEARNIQVEIQEVVEGAIKLRPDQQSFRWNSLGPAATVKLFYIALSGMARLPSSTLSSAGRMTPGKREVGNPICRHD